MLVGRAAMELGQEVIDRLEEHGSYGFVMYVIDQDGSVNQLSNMLLEDIYALLCKQIRNYQLEHEGVGHA